MQHTNASKTVRAPSLIDTLSQGFRAVNRRLWVLLIPLALDLFYWSGPRLSPQPLLDNMFRLMQAVDPQAWAQLRRQLGDQITVTGFPIDLSFWSWPQFIRLLIPLIATPATPPFTPTVWHIGGIGTLLGAFALIAVISLVATSLYLVPLAQVVRADAPRQHFVQRWSKVFVSLLGIMLMVIGLMLAVLVPMLIVVALANAVNAAAAQLISVIGSAVLLWIMFTLSFSFDAVVVSDANPLRALLTSLFVVQRSFWGAAGLLLVSWLIFTGLSIVWQMVAGSVVGLIIAMVGSAYISSGLAAAHLIFFRDRLSRVGRRA